MRRLVPGSLAVVLSLGCARAPAPPAASAGESPPVSIPVAAPEPVPMATTSSCVEPALPPAPEREAAIDAFLADRPREALDRLDAVLRADPRDRAAEAFRRASKAKLAEAQARAFEEIVHAHPIPLQPIPLAQTLRRAAPAAPGKVRLAKTSESKNLVTDFADWEKKNALEHLGRRHHDLPGTVPEKIGPERLRVAFVHADHVVAIYRSILVVTGDGKKPLVFDVRSVTSTAPRPFDIPFAQLVGSTLLVELAYNGYAKESGGKNGYFAAFDASSGALAWSSEPLVANAWEAVVAGGSIITGYGFTSEPDFLFVLDQATGKVEQKIPLKSGPSAIRAKGDRVFVRAYDVDYVFESATGLPPALPADLPASADAAAPRATTPEARCWIRHATAAILAKDASALHEARARLKTLSRDGVLHAQLALEEEKLASPDLLDLTAAPLVVVPAPPWQAASPGAGPAPRSSPKLVTIASHKADPTRNMHPRFDPTKPWFIAPIEKGKLPPGAREDIPSSFGREHLSSIIPDERRDREGRLLLVYGGRHVALVAGDAVERVFDLDSFRHPPKADPKWKEFAVQPVTYAQERDGVLYVCNGGGSYAREVYGKKGFLSAIDATTGKLLWRSAPLTCNSTFAIAGDHIVTGYGFTSEPDFVFLVRRSDGKIVQKVPIGSAPETITLDGNRVHVEAYGHVVDLELR